jgi:hypothetical protein
MHHDTAIAATPEAVAFRGDHITPSSMLSVPFESSMECSFLDVRPFRYPAT